jgi:predicted CopG family antitoxin
MKTLTINDDLHERLIELKKAFGFKNMTETIESLFNTASDSMKQLQSTAFHVRDLREEIAALEQRIFDIAAQDPDQDQGDPATS